ncbi:MAG: hypothetical protein JXA95_01470 [Spirochaetales bacterium]|nr:hypothetical protein [Spirochaetales bacterium]
MKHLFLLFAATLVSCGGSPMTDGPPPVKDKVPPVLLDFRVDSREEITLIFDEPVEVNRETMIREPAGEVGFVSRDEGELTLRFTPACEPGSVNTLRLDAADSRGNGNWFLFEFYAPNENQPELIINEVSPNGSSSRPDMVEFYALTGGETTGLTLLLGTEDDWDSRYRFPPMEIGEGEYIILHCRPEGIAEEISETGDDLDLSGGRRAEAGVRDLWPPEDMNLSGSNGVLTLISLPVKGKCRDRLVYTNRTGDPQDRYRGWTSALWPQVQEISLREENARGWLFEGDFLNPEDGVWSDDTTSTRTLCRSSLSEDGDTRGDWHTVPTGGCTFGYPNTDEVYSP